MMRALVTGGTGCVGSNLVAVLNQRGVRTRVLHRRDSSLEALEGLEYEPIVADILDPEEDLVAAMKGCDCVFHVAAISDYWRYRKPKQIYDVNVGGTRNVLRAAARAGVRRVVYTSSLAALGVPAEGQMLSETNEFNLSPLQFPYGHSKHLAEIEVRRAVEQGLEVVVVNPTAVIGPRDRKRIGGSFLFEALKGRLRFAPPGGVNFVAVEDVALGHLHAAERAVPGQRYILGGQNIDYRSAFATICEVVGRPPPQAVIPRWMVPPLAMVVDGAGLVSGGRLPVDANQIRLSALNLFADTTRARRELGLPDTPFRTAVEHAHDWYAHHGYLKH